MTITVRVSQEESDDRQRERHEAELFGAMLAQFLVQQDNLFRVAGISDAKLQRAQWSPPAVVVKQAPAGWRVLRQWIRQSRPPAMGRILEMYSVRVFLWALARYLRDLEVSETIRRTIQQLGSVWAHDLAEDMVEKLDETTAMQLWELIPIWYESYQPTDGLVADVGSIFADSRIQIMTVGALTAAIYEAARLLMAHVDEVDYLIWRTKRDERVCPICRPLDGEVSDDKGRFGPDLLSPPAHIRCRCEVEIITIRE